MSRLSFVYSPFEKVKSLGLALGIIIPAFALAESTADESVTKLEPFVTEGRREKVAVESFTGLTGLAGGVAEAPRSATLINREQLDAMHVTRVEELAPLIPGASSAPPYGLTGVPLLRGDLGDAAQNGQRKAYNRNVFPVSFNSVESVEVLAGAPPVWLGYTHGTGGFVNFVTKQPTFDRTKVLLNATLGSWDERRWQIDINQRWSQEVAARLSVERVDAGSFYRLVGEESWDAYFALTWRPGARVRWDLSLEVYDADYSENPGTNRPTQALIDHGDYITGSSVQNGGTGSYFGNTFTPTGTTHIDGSQVLLAPGDNATARVYTGQLTGTWQTGGGGRVVNRTYFESVDSEKYAAYHFYSYVPLSYTLENRLEIHSEHEWGAIQHALVWGGAVRGEQRESYVDFLNEAMNSFDVTLDPDTLRLPVSVLRFVKPVPGRPGRWAVPGGRYGTLASVGISQTLRSRLLNAGLFFQDQITFTPQLSLLLGGRADVVTVRVEDPLAPIGFTPAQDRQSNTLPAGSASLVWHPQRELTVYATVQEAVAVESSSSSGGFGLSNNRLPEVLFENGSRLFEVGIKGSAQDGRLSWSVAAYHQRRQRMNPRFGLPDEILARGVESAVSWMIVPHFTVTANFAYQDIHYLNGPLPGSIATVPQFDPTKPSDNFGAFTSGDYRVPGLPRWQANIQAAYAPPQGWGVRLWSSLQGAQNLDLFGRVIIPAQQTWNAGVLYRTGAWEFSADVLNFTDEFNWRPTSTPFAGADLVTRELPRHGRVTVRYRF